MLYAIFTSTGEKSVFETEAEATAAFDAKKGASIVTLQKYPHLHKGDDPALFDLGSVIVQHSDPDHPTARVVGGEIVIS